MPNIKDEYTQLMKQDIAQLRKTYSASHKVSDTRGVPKSSLVTDILIAKHGAKKVKAALGESKNALKESDQSWDQSLLQRAKQFDRNELRAGLKAEKEHDTDDELDVVKDKNDLLKIVLAHLEEDPQYYTKLAKVETETYGPSEYPGQRDPYRTMGQSYGNYPTVVGMGYGAKKLANKNKPLGRKRPRLKESVGGSTVTYAMIVNEGAKVKGDGATGTVSLHRDQAPTGQGFYIDVNGKAIWNPVDPHDATVIEMVNIVSSKQPKYGEELGKHGVEPKAAYEFVVNRIKQAGLRKFLNAVRKAAKTQDTQSFHSFRLRALVRPSLTGTIKFVEYDYNRFEFSL